MHLYAHAPSGRAPNARAAVPSQEDEVLTPPSLTARWPMHWPPGLPEGLPPALSPAVSLTTPTTRGAMQQFSTRQLSTRQLSTRSWQRLRHRSWQRLRRRQQRGIWGQLLTPPPESTQMLHAPRLLQQLLLLRQSLLPLWSTVLHLLRSLGRCSGFAQLHQYGLYQPWLEEMRGSLSKRVRVHGRSSGVECG